MGGSVMNKHDILTWVATFAVMAMAVAVLVTSPC